MEKYPAKNHVLLGSNTVLDQMAGRKLPRQQHHANKMKAVPTLTKLIDLAGKTPRNIILDADLGPKERRQTASALQAFGTRRCVTIVNNDVTQAHRSAQQEREGGKPLPEDARHLLRATYNPPALNDGFTILEWPELSETDAIAEINESKIVSNNLLEKKFGVRFFEEVTTDDCIANPVKHPESLASMM